jgi:hypothetical protein
MSVFIKLTRPDHGSIWVNVEAINLFREPLAGEYPPGVKCVVVVGDSTLAVEEDSETVTALIKP